MNCGPWCDAWTGELKQCFCDGPVLYSPKTRRSNLWHSWKRTGIAFYFSVDKVSTIFSTCGWWDCGSQGEDSWECDDVCSRPANKWIPNLLPCIHLATMASISVKANLHFGEEKKDKKIREDCSRVFSVVTSMDVDKKLSWAEVPTGPEQLTVVEPEKVLNFF